MPRRGQVASTLLVVGLLAGCGRSQAITVGGAAASPPSPTPSTDVAVVRANAAVRQAATSLASATSRLAGDFTWTRTAIPAGGKLPSDPSTMSLYTTQIAGIGAGSAHAALQRARTAAKSKPPNCALVSSEKAAIAGRASEARAALAAVDALTSSALGALERATTDRAAVQAALGHLNSVIRDNPAATVETDVQRWLAATYTAQEQQQLTAAVLRAHANAQSAASSVQTTVSAAAAVGTICH